MAEENKNLNLITKSAGIVLIGLIISKILGYAYRLITARLGTADYGLLSITLATASILTYISLLGTNEGITRYVSLNKKENEEKVKSVINSALNITLPIGIILALALYLCSDLIAQHMFKDINLSILLKIIAVVIPVDIVRNTIISIIRAYKQIKYETIAKAIIENIFKVALTIILLYLGLGIKGAAIAYVLSVIASTTISIYLTEKHIIKLRKIIVPFKKEIYTNKLLIYSFPLLMNNITFLFIEWTDTFAIGIFRNISEVGVYNAAMPIAMTIYIIPNALTIILLPILTELRNNKLEFEKIYYATTKWILISSTTLILIYTVFSKTMLSILFGQEYMVGSIALTILVLGNIPYVLALSSNKVLLALKKTRLIMTASIISAIINIVLNLILIPKYGINGAAIATGISFVIMGVMLMFFTNKITHIKPINQNCVKIILSAAISLIATYVLNKLIFANNTLLTIIISLLIYLIIYAFVLIWRNCIEREDILMLETIQQKTKIKFLIPIINTLKRFAE